MLSELYCPLCLKELSSDGKLVLWCSAHPTAAKEVSAGGDLSLDLRCAGRGCGQLDRFEPHAQYLLHRDCKAMNPYWKDGKIATPQGSIEHWEHGLMAELAHSASDLGPEMWFPAALLRGLSRPGGRQSAGALVSLQGSKKVGKTVLAMMALSVGGYVQPEDGQEVPELHDFVFTPPKEGTGAPSSTFEEALRIRRSLGRESPLEDEVEGTQRHEVANVKAVMLSTSAPRPEPAPAPRRPAPPRRETAIQHLMDFLRDADHVATAGSAAAPPVRRKLPTPPAGSVLQFVDSAGESAARPADIQLARLASQADVIAVLIRAEDIAAARSFTNEGNSLVHAVECLHVARKVAGQRHCVVVTQVDRLLDVGKPWAHRREIVEMLATDSTTTMKNARTFLGDRLDERQDSNFHRQLGTMLRRAERPIDGVHFVWTHNIGKGAAMPAYSLGIAKLVHWILAPNVQAALP